MKIILEKGQKRLIPILFKSNQERLDVNLVGDGSEVEVVGLVMGEKTDERSFEVYITHTGKNTKSKVNVRAVMRGKSTFDFRGNVRIENGAKGADAYLRSDALLFDDAKMGDDTPALEILERDVKAGHAATIGKVDEVMLFYLMSRGISKVQAEKLLIAGFTQPILDKIKNRREDYAKS
jgi:Fe-S cluster assembly protein SufD